MKRSQAGDDAAAAPGVILPRILIAIWLISAPALCLIYMMMPPSPDQAQIAFLAKGGPEKDRLGLVHVVQQKDAPLEPGENFRQLAPVEMPVGGFGQSGLGRENGIETLYAHTRAKSVLVSIGKFEGAYPA